MTKQPMGKKVRAGGRRMLRAVAPTMTDSVSQVPRLRRRVAEQDAAIKELRGKLKATRRQITELRREIDETRRLHQRVAELTDAVAELLVPAMDRDDARVQKALEAFNKSTF
jgi:predicted RNase H-like nuclease (RuvC/YqgF family)